MVNIKEKVGEGYILCRIIIEVIGKPKVHVEKTIADYIDKIKEESNDVIFISEDLAEIEEMKEKEVWSQFVEMEILFKNIEIMTNFCFDYMPSSIEILEPDSATYEASYLTGYFNDMLARLHNLGMHIRTQKMQLETIEENMGKLFENYIKILVKNKPLAITEISKYTGASEKQLKSILEFLVEEKILAESQGKYGLVK